MLLPEYVLEGWTTLGPEVSAEQVIALYRDHATHEQSMLSSRPTWT
ncbi:hypothetical protein [Ottowia sp.]|nr:hypothetical protein [Ottowia sp.]